MNERIKEIAYRASEHTDFEDLLCTDEFLQKFAEFIVMDIISIIEPTEEHRRDASWGYLGGNEGVELLDRLVVATKKHFGL